MKCFRFSPVVTTGPQPRHAGPHSGGPQSAGRDRPRRLRLRLRLRGAVIPARQFCGRILGATFADDIYFRQNTDFFGRLTGAATRWP